MRITARAFAAGLIGFAIALLGLAASAEAAIDVNKSFSPATRYPGQISRLEIRLLNSALVPSTSVNLTDVFPDDVFIAGTPNLSSTCGGTTTPSNTATRGEVVLAGGTIPAGDGTNPGVCLIGVDVYSSRKGTYINEIPIGAVTAVTGGSPEANTQASQGTLAVILQDLTYSIAVGLGGTVQGYETTSYTITLTNPNPVPLTGTSFIHDLWQNGYHLRATDAGATTCGAGTVNITPRPPRTSTFGPTSQIALAGGVIPANGSCTVTFTVEPSRDPQLPYNATGLSQTIPINAISTNEGATNSAAGFYAATTYTGVSVTKLFNGTTNSSVNLITQPTSQLRLVFVNYNVTTPVSNFSLSDVMPTSPAQMTVDSINSNTCGGTATTGTSLDMSGANLAGATANAAGLQTVSCAVEATVSYPSAGTYTNRIPEGTASTGSIGGFQYDARSAILNVSGRILEISKAFSNWSQLYQGDTTDLTFTLTNASPTVTVSNIDLADNMLATMGTGFRIGSAGVVSNTCGATPVVVADATSFQLNDMSVAPSSTCTVTVQVQISADAWPAFLSFSTRTNRVPAGNVTFDTPGNTGQVFPLDVTAQLRLYPAIRLQKTFTPTIVGPLGTTRLRLAVLRYGTTNKSSTSALALTDNMPAGFQIAAVPNISNGCGGTLIANPGDTSIILTGGSIPAFTGSQTQCVIEVNVQAPPLTPPATTQNFTNTIIGAVPGSPSQLTAIHDGQPAPYNNLQLHQSQSANLTVRATSVSANKEFTPTAINGGAASRVTITFSNVEPTAINLTGVSLTDSFASTDMRLYSNVNPTFTDLAGNPNANGCRGGVFTGAPGASSFTLTGAQIDAGRNCKLEFNVTAFKGGNHINTLSAGDLITNEGVTNNSNVAATLTVGRQVNVGKGFLPDIIAAGEQSTLTIDFYNTNVAPNNETGASPALIDTLPAGLTIVGTPTTNCAGGSVSTGTTAGQQFIRLDGGTFVAENVCQVTAQVTAAASGVYENVILAGELTTLSGAQNPDTARATLRVIAPPTITKSFLTTAIPIAGTSRIRFTIANPNNATLAPTGLTGVSFSDTLVNMTIAAPLYVAGSCTGLTHNAAIGGASFIASNISLAPSASCFIDLDVTSSSVGLHDNQTTGLTSNQTVGAGAPSNVAQLRVLEPVTLTKSFAAASVAVNEPVRMTFVLTNPNPVAAWVGTPGFTDIFPVSPGAMVVAPVPGITSECGIVFRSPPNIVAPVPGDTGIFVRSGTVPANGTCTIGINVVANAAGNYVNTTSTLTTAGGIGPAASAPLTVIPRISSIETTKTATVTVANGTNNTITDAGDVVTYAITIRNTGNTTLTSVGVASDTLTRLGGGALSLTTGPTFVSNSSGSAAGTLVPNETATFTATYTLVQADIDAGGVSNTATGTGTPSGGPAVTDVSDDGIDTDGNTADDPTETPITRTPSIETTKTAIATVAAGASPTVTDAGDAVNYTITVRNTGNVTLTAVGIASDTLTRLGGGALTLTSGPTFTSNSGASPAGTLVPGETATFSASYTLVQADIDAGGVSNTATGTGTPPTGPAVTDVSDDGIDTDGNTTNDPTETTITRTPSIETTKTAIATVAAGASPTLTDAGDAVNYTLTVRNTGNVTLTAVGIASDTLTRLGGGALTLTSGPTFTSNSGASPAGTLVPGETATFTASYTLVQADIDAGGVSNTATGTGTPPTGPAVTDVSDDGIDTDGNTTNDPTETIVTRTPSIETTKTAIATVAAGASPTLTDAGDAVNYTITVRNTGNVTLTVVGIASDTLTRLGGGALTLTSGPTFTSNSGASPAGTLVPGETATFTASYTLVQADIDAGGVANTATGRGTPPTGPAVTDVSDDGIDTDGNTTDDPTETAITRTPSIETTKTATVTLAGGAIPTLVDAGDVVNYTITVRNTGNVTLTSVGIASDTLTRLGGGALTLTTAPTFVSNSGASAAGTLAPGETATFTASYTLVQADIAAGGVSNTATGTGTPPTGPAVTDISDDGIDTDGNTADDPTETQITSAPAIEATKTATVTVAAGANSTVVDAGDTVTYTIALRNVGNTTLSAVGVASDTLTRTGGGALTLTSGPVFVSNSGASTAGNLIPGETATFTATYTLVQADIDAGGVSNTATGSGTPPTGPAVTDVSDDGIDTDGNTTDDPTETVIASAPGIEVTKTAIASVAAGNSPTVVDAGDTVTYTIAVRNTGNTSLSSVGIASDTLTRLGGGALTLTTPPTFVSNSGASPAGTLLPGETATFSAAYTLVQADIDAGGVSNTATGRGTPPTGPAVTDVSDDGIDTDGNTTDDPTETIVTRAPSIETTKTAVATIASGANAAITDAGDTVNYTITIRNTGNTTLSTVGIASDTLTRLGGGALTLTTPPTFVSNSGASPAGTLLPGETATFSAAYTLVQADIDAGGVSNTATGRGTPPTGPAVTDVSDDGIDTDGNTTDDPTETIVTRTPSVETTKTAVATVASGASATATDAGDAVNYTITVRNTGNVTLAAVAIASDTLTRLGGGALTLTTPPTFVSNSGASPAGTLAPGETATFSAAYTLVQADIDAGGVSNTATGTGTPPTGPAVTDVSDDGIDTDGNTTDDPTETAIARTASIETTKTAVATVTAGANATATDAGDAVNYTITIRNMGNVTLTSVGIASDTLTRLGGGALTLTTPPTFVSNSGASPAGTLAPGETATFSAAYTLVQADIDAGGVSNTATGSGTPPTGPAVTDVSDDGIDTDGNTTDDPTDTPITRSPAIGLVKTASTAAFSTPPRPGDVITYTYVATNLGNVTLTNVAITEAPADFTGTGTLPSPAYASGGGDLDGGLGTPTDIAPGQTVTFTAPYALTQADINSGTVTNRASATGSVPGGGTVSDLSDESQPTPGNDDPTQVTIPRAPALQLKKTLDQTTQIYPFVYEVFYTLRLQNTGNTLVSQVRMQDDLRAALTPGQLLSAPAVTIIGFSGTPVVNAGFDGSAVTELLSGNPELLPSQTGEVRIRARVSFVNGFPPVGQGNTAYASSTEVPGPVRSDDPTITPGNPLDTNPTPDPAQDADNDGSPDTRESDTNDRDGDGTPDNRDYDPTGYFYCEETGNILTGGLVSVTGPLGTQRGAGTSNNITIVRDGAAGSYQFHVSAPGRYVLSYDLPPTGVASTSRLPAGDLDVTSLLPANPAVLGGGEVGSTARLSDFTAAGNRFYRVFDIEENDPTVFNNNIPLMHCGVPAVSAAKQLVGTPTLLSSGATRVTFRTTIQSTGSTQVRNATLTDDLNAVFGAGNHVVSRVALVEAPIGFTAGHNPAFNGASDINLLTAGGILEPSQRVIVEFQVDVRVTTSGTFVNTVTAGGQSPLSGLPVAPAIATASVDAQSPDALGQLVVEKATKRTTARLGDVIPYTVTVKNPATRDRVGVDIVDFMPAGFTYRPSTGRVDGVANEPTLSGRRVVWRNLTIPANATVRITFNLGVGAAAAGSEFVNLAWAEDPISGNRISNTGKAVVKRELEHVFDCGEIVGKVFDDKNRNGYPDEGEPGLPGVRVVTARGRLITTDKHGRFNVPCADIPDENIGSNFILKIDTRTLPTGYRVTTENPRVMRLTRGKLSVANFGASISSVVRIDLNAGAFVGQTSEPGARLARAIDQLVEKLLTSDPTVVSLSYRAVAPSENAAERLKTVSRLLSERWQKAGGRYRLDIETRTVTEQ